MLCRIAISILIIIVFPSLSVADAGYALQFDGVDDYVNIPGNQIYEFGNGDFTFEMWLKCYQIQGDARVIIANQISDDFQLAFGITQSDSVLIQFYGGSTLRIETDSLSWNLNQWYHIALTRHNDTLRIFIDGVESISGIYGETCGNQTDLNIGYRKSTNSHPFDGEMDEVRIWNTAKTQEEIQESMYTQLSGNEDGLIGYWRFDEGSGDIAYDLSPSGINGQLGNSAGTDPADPIWVVSTAPITGPRVWHISVTGDDITGDGSSGNPFATIQHGIDIATNRDTVLVHPGTYLENINFNGHNIVLGSLFLTTGDTSYIPLTIIDGNASGSVISVSGSVHDLTQIIGLTIRNGNTVHGGGINCLSGANPTIANNIITDNWASGGGGINCQVNCNPLIIDNIIINNEAGSGGGICTYDSWPTIERNLIYNNEALNCGGGIYLRSYDDPANINQNTIYNNIAGDNGGGICSAYNSIAVVSNTILWGNTAPDSSGQLGIQTTGSFDVTYSDVQDGWTGEGNINSDPLFVYTAGEDYHLTQYSPCIDAGYPTSPYDPDSTIIDMGVFYYHKLRTITGIVADQDQIPVESVTVSITGFLQTGLTDLNGEYILDSLEFGLYDISFSHYDYRDTLIVDLHITPNDTTLLNIELTELPSFILGNVTDIISLPIENVAIEIMSTSFNDTTDTSGAFSFENIFSGEYDISFMHADFRDTVISNISVTPGDTSIVNMIMQVACDYVIGDANNSGGYNGLDITYGVNYFKGGSEPSFFCYCPPHNTWFVAADVNGSCSYNGLDITYGVNFFKGGDNPIPCADCPPTQ